MRCQRQNSRRPAVIRAVLPLLMSNIRQHSGPFPFLSPSVPACPPWDPLGPIPYLCSWKQRTKEPQYHSHSSLYQSENITPSSCDCACECVSVPSPPQRLALETNHILCLFSTTVNEGLAEAAHVSVSATGSPSPHLLHTHTQKKEDFPELSPLDCNRILMAKPLFWFW